MNAEKTKKPRITRINAKMTRIIKTEEKEKRIFLKMKDSHI